MSASQNQYGIGLDKCGYRTGENARAAPFCVGQQRLGRRDRLSHSLFSDRNSEFGRLDEVGLDLRRPLGVDAFDAVAPCRMLGRIGFELVRRQIPAQPAAPSEWQPRQLVCQPFPLGHGADAQPEIDFRIAPAGIDPGKRVRRGDATCAALRGHRHLRAGLAEMPGDGGADDAGADDDDLLAHAGPLPDWPF